MYETQKTKLALAASLMLATQVYAQSVPNLVVTAKPDIAEIEIDKFSITSAVITDETIRDLHAADLASALRPGNSNITLQPSWLIWWSGRLVSFYSMYGSESPW